MEHTRAPKAAVHRLVAAAPTRDQRDLAFDWRVGAGDVVRVKMHLEEVGMRQRHALQLFANDILDSVDQFLHEELLRFVSASFAILRRCTVSRTPVTYSLL